MKALLAVEILVISLLSALIVGQNGGDVPQRPLDLQGSSRFEGAVAVAELSWRDQSDNELGFEVLRSDNGGDYRVVGMVGANTVRFDDRIGRYVTGAFTYKVRAFNQAGKSGESNAVSVWF